ncbi:MAG: glycosyltransferase family 4 protein [Gammaproteobacteria bacterium]
MQLLPELNAGGVERGTLEMNQAIVDAGHRSIVVSGGGRLEPEIARYGGEHLTIPVGRKSLLWTRQIYRLRRAMLYYRPDIIHWRSRMPAWVASAARNTLPKAMRPKVVSTVHGLYSTNFYSAIMTKADAVIAVSDSVRKYLLKYYPRLSPEKIQVIFRGVDTSQFPPNKAVPDGFIDSLLKDCPQAKNRKLIAFPGRITRKKGLLSMVRLLREIGDKLDVHVLVFGELRRNKRRVWRQTLAAAKKLGVADRISFLGPRQDVANLYAASSLVLQLSEEPEAFGRVVAEALNVGTPVLGWAHGGVGEILNHAYPFGRIPKGDYSILAARVSDVLAGNAPKTTPGLFPLEKMQQSTIELYESLI